MELEAFLSRNKISLPDLVLSLCHEGIEITRNGIDPLHDENHTFRILTDLDQFLREETKIERSEVNFEVLLLSICWHDVWRAKIFPKNVISLLFALLWDGLGGARMFAKRAKQVGLEQEMLSPISYAIRKHTSFQIFPPKTLEAKILKDLDNLEGWSLTRIKALKERYLVPGKIEPKLLRLAKFYFDHFMAKMSTKASYFEWSKSEFLKRKKDYMDEVNRLLLKYGDLL